MRIKELRIENKYTQLELANEVGCNQTAIGKYERGDLEPNLEVLFKLSRIFNCSIDYLVGNSDDFGNIVINSGKDLGELSPNEEELLELFNNKKRESQLTFSFIGYNTFASLFTSDSFRVIEMLFCTMMSSAPFSFAKSVMSPSKYL